MDFTGDLLDLCSQQKNRCISELRWTFHTILVSKSISMIPLIDLAWWLDPIVDIRNLTRTNVSDPPQKASYPDFFARRFISPEMGDAPQILRCGWGTVRYVHK